MTMDCTTCGSPHAAHLAPGHACENYQPAIRRRVVREEQFRLEYALSRLYVRYWDGDLLTTEDVATLHGIGQQLLALAEVAGETLDGIELDDDGMGDVVLQEVRRRQRREGAR